MARSSRNRQVVPESREMLKQMKYEIAAEFDYPWDMVAVPMEPIRNLVLS